MKIALTLFFLSMITGFLALIIDIVNRTDYWSDDGGWTTHYKISVKVRKFTQVMGYVCLLLFTCGGLWTIWSVN